MSKRLIAISVVLTTVFLFGGRYYAPSLDRSEATEQRVSTIKLNGHAELDRAYAFEKKKFSYAIRFNTRSLEYSKTQYLYQQKVTTQLKVNQQYVQQIEYFKGQFPQYTPPVISDKQVIAHFI